MGKIHFWRNDREALIGITFLLLLIGTINVFSSTFVLAEMNFDTPYFFIKKHLISLVIGVGALVIGAIFNYHVWERWSKYLAIIIGVSLFLLFPLQIGPVVNGARRWIPLGAFQFQPSEFAKLVAIMLEAGYLSWCIRKMKKVTFFHTQMLIILFFSLLVERQPDGMTAAIILGVPILMMLISNMPNTSKYAMLMFFLVGAILLCVVQPYRLERMVAVIDPWGHIREGGYQTVQSMAAIGSGGLNGMGIGMGVSKYQYLPEAHTDFAFAVFCQEAGFIFALLVFILFAAFSYYGIKIANHARDAFGQYLAAGITFYISGQAVSNFLMLSGCFPVVGIPLPFISYGGTALIMTLACVGILFNIDKCRQEKRVLGIDEVLSPVGKYPRLRRIK